MLPSFITRIAGSRLHRFSALIGAIPAAALALAAAAAAQPIAAALDKPALAGWLVQLAPFLIFTTLLTLNAGGAIAAVVGILFGVGVAIYCAKMAASSDTPRERKPWWIGGVVVGALISPAVVERHAALPRTTVGLGDDSLLRR